MDEDSEAIRDNSVRVTFLRLLLIDDHQLLTEAVAHCLCASNDLWVAARCTTDDPNLTEVVAQVHPDVIALDVEQLGAEAGPTTARLAAAAPAACIVALTDSQDPRKAVAAARAGVVAWVPKQGHLVDFVATVRAARRGHAVFPPDLLGAVLRDLRADAHRYRCRMPPPPHVAPRLAEQRRPVQPVRGTHRHHH
ncbi:MAG TPA: response regulator [Pseudonocardiaceae bacterium]|nr:response regulator [Pseudonocardiaceae bacterium]